MSMTMRGDDGGEAARIHEFPSRRASERAINPPKDHDRADARRRDSDAGEWEKEDTRRKVSRSLTSYRDSPETVLQPRSFSLQVSRGGGRRSFYGGRFPSRRPCWPPAAERNPRVGEPLSDLHRMPEVNRGMRRDPGGRRVLLRGDGRTPTPSRLQFRRVNADMDRRRRGAVNLMDSEGNSSHDPAGAINPGTSRRKPEELSRDSLLSPRGAGVSAERSAVEPRRGGRVAIQRKVLLPAETTGRNGAMKRRSRRSTQEDGSRTVSLLPLMMSVFCRSERTERETFYEEWRASLPVSEGRRVEQQLVRTPRCASLLPLKEITDDYGNLMSQSVRDSRSRASRDLRARQSPVSQRPSFVSTVRSIIVSVFRTLGMFIQVGRQIMNVVESNAAFACTKEYLWLKIVNWIDA